MVNVNMDMDGMRGLLCLIEFHQKKARKKLQKKNETQPYNRVIRQIPPAIPGTYGRMILSVV